MMPDGVRATMLMDIFHNRRMTRVDFFIHEYGTLSPHEISGFWCDLQIRIFYFSKHPKFAVWLKLVLISMQLLHALGTRWNTFKNWFTTKENA